MAEHTVAEQVAAVLGLSAAELDPSTDLITQGLDSLRMMRLAGQWRKAGHDIDFARLAAEPTVAAWEELLAVATPATSSTPTRTATPDHRDREAESTQPFPLAPMQHAYWVGRSDSHALGDVAAHLYIEFDGTAIDSDAFSAAVAQLLHRHPMLRTRIYPDGTQSVGPAHPNAYECYDLRDLPEHEIEAALALRRERGTHRKLPIEDGAMLRAELTLLPAGRARIHLDVDMLAADAMSYRVIVDDLARLYHGEKLAPLDLTYRELAEVRGQRTPTDADVEWWRGRIPALSGPPELPTVPVGQFSAPHTVRLHHAITADDWKRLDDHARSRGVTPAAAVAAAFAEAVGTQAAEPRFLLTVPMFDRDSVDLAQVGLGDRDDLERVVGDFTSSLILDVDLTEEATLLQRARTMRESMHEAAAHGSFGGLDVLRELSRQRGETVVSPVVFTSALGLGELFSANVAAEFGTPDWIVSQGPQVLLDAQVTEVAGGLLLNWDVRESDLPITAARAMFDYYVSILDLLIEGEWDRSAPTAVTAETAAQRRSTEQPLPATEAFDGTLHGTFFARADARADHPAVITDERTWTHGDLAGEAQRVAATLRESGIGSGATVVIHLPKSGDQVVAALGVLLAGAAYVPISPTQPQARRDRILSVATPAAILTLTPEDWPADTAAGARVIHLDRARSSQSSHGKEPGARLEPFPDVTPDSLAYVLFTSGSTGLPKGVELPHRAAVATLTDLVDRYRLTDTDRTLMVSALEFDLSVFDIFGILSVGGAVVIPPPNEQGGADSWVRLLHAHDITVLNCVPAILGMLLDLTELPATLRTIIMGGDKVEVSLLDRVLHQLPDCRIAGLGGTTETAIHSTICEAPDVPAGAAFVPYGIPLRGVCCRVVDIHSRDRPDFVPGELWIGGAGVAAGYRGDPQRSADRFVTHDGERWYRTGDMVRYLPGGFLDFLGRADHMVKVRGHRVELGEVEAALLRIPNITGAVAWSDSRDLHAAVTTDGGTTVAARELLAADLPEHMIPRTVTSVEALPLTANGKYDRARIQMLVTPTADGAVVAARTPIEAALADIVGTLLECESVDVTADFIALGGDSVVATRYTATVRDWLGAAELTVADVFSRRTVAALAQRLEELDGPRSAAIAEEYLAVMALSDEDVEAELTGEAL